MSAFSEIVATDLSDALDDAFADTGIAYTPANGAAISGLTAIIGPTEVLIDGSQIVTLSHENRDFSIKSAALAIAGESYEPQRGDTITEVKAGKTYTYDVLIPDGLHQCWTWADRFRIRRKVHAKLRGVA